MTKYRSSLCNVFCKENLQVVKFKQKNITLWYVKNIHIAYSIFTSSLSRISDKPERIKYIPGSMNSVLENYIMFLCKIRRFRC